MGLGLNSVAELFLGQAEKLATLYVSYCQGKTASEQLIVANLSFFNELQHYVKLDLPLSSYLIKPVQRITKYPLLLKVVSMSLCVCYCVGHYVYVTVCMLLCVSLCVRHYGYVTVCMSLCIWCMKFGSCVFCIDSYFGFY